MKLIRSSKQFPQNNVTISKIFNYFDILKLKVLEQQKKRENNRLLFTPVVIEYQNKLSLQSLSPVGYLLPT